MIKFNILTKVDPEAKFQGLQLLPKKLFMFVIAKLINIDFSVGQKLFTSNSLKRDRAALEGLPSAALGP